jgi:hypothetical protein
MQPLACLFGLTALGAAVAISSSAPAQPICSVFDNRPCTPSFCSVFDPEPCLPDFGFPIGQGLRVTIGSRSTDHERADHSDQPVGPTGEINTIREIFAALRACWVPPPKDDARRGMEYSVRLSFKRSGEIIAKPRVTYVTRGISDETREVYRNAVTAALERCAPLPFTKGLGGAIAGRPISIRFVDDRNL